VRFGHEYRATIGLIGLMFLFTGLVDALLEDYVLKYFITLSILFVFMLAVIYELIWYKTPSNPFMESALATLALFTSAIGVHGATWLYISMLLGREVGRYVWLAPHVVVSEPVFYTVTFTCLLAYLGILVAVNVLGGDEE